MEKHLQGAEVEIGSKASSEALLGTDVANSSILNFASLFPFQYGNGTKQQINQYTSVPGKKKEKVRDINIQIE